MTLSLSFIALCDSCPTQYPAVFTDRQAAYNLLDYHGWTVPQPGDPTDTLHCPTCRSREMSRAFVSSFRKV